MPIIIVLLCLIAGTISSCDAAHAFSTEQIHKDYGPKLEVSAKEQLKAYVCEQLYCPEHLNIDEFKTTGRQFAAIKISTRWRF